MPDDGLKRFTVGRDRVGLDGRHDDTDVGDPGGVTAVAENEKPATTVADPGEQHNQPFDGLTVQPRGHRGDFFKIARYKLHGLSMIARWSRHCPFGWRRPGS